MPHALCAMPLLLFSDICLLNVFPVNFSIERKLLPLADGTEPVLAGRL
jgi:hypothetical protein